MSAVGSVTQSIPPAKPAARKDTAAAPGGGTYTFKEGDTVFGIVSSRMGGSGDVMGKTQEVLSMNGLDMESAKNMPVGFELKLPPDLSGEKAAEPPPEDPPKQEEEEPKPPPAPKISQENQMLLNQQSLIRPNVNPQPVAKQKAPPPRPAENPAPAPPPPPPPPPAVNRNTTKPKTQTVAKQIAPAPPAGTRRNNPNRLTVAVVDTYAPDNTGARHGEQIEKTIRAGGGNPKLAGKVNTLRFSVDGPEGLTKGLAARAANALEQIIQRIKRGDDIDVVNMSLQDYRESTGSQRVRRALQTLRKLNVPVLVAAGNFGPQAINVLKDSNAFIVQSATDGRTNPSSGRGNIQGESSTTSFATAKLSPQVGALANSGMNVEQLRARLIR